MVDLPTLSGGTGGRRRTGWRRLGRLEIWLGGMLLLSPAKVMLPVLFTGQYTADSAKGAHECGRSPKRKGRGLDMVVAYDGRLDKTGRRGS